MCQACLVALAQCRWPSLSALACLAVPGRPGRTGAVQLALPHCTRPPLFVPGLPGRAGAVQLALPSPGPPLLRVGGPSRDGSAAGLGGSGRRPLAERLRMTAQDDCQPLPLQLLRKYIAYARHHVTPRLSVEAKQVGIWGWRGW